MYQQMYQTNKEFKEYVDKYCNSLRHKKTPEEAFKDIMVQSYADYLKTRGDRVSPYEYQQNCGC